MANYNRLFRSRWYGSIFALSKHDRFADLRLRFLVGPAAGYRFFEREDLTLSAEGAVMYLNDDFLDQADQEFWGPGTGCRCWPASSPASSTRSTTIPAPRWKP